MNSILCYIFLLFLTCQDWVDVHLQLLHCHERWWQICVHVPELTGGQFSGVGRCSALWEANFVLTVNDIHILVSVPLLRRQLPCPHSPLFLRHCILFVCTFELCHRFWMRNNITRQPATSTILITQMPLTSLFLSPRCKGWRKERA